MKKKSLITVVCICLAAVLLCGGFCYATVSYVNGQIKRSADAGPDAAFSEASAAPVGVAQYNLTLNQPSGKLLSGTDIYEMACQQVVGISTEVTSTNVFGQVVTGSVSGTGFFISADGYILTNNHVVEKAYTDSLPIIVMLHDGTEYQASIVGVEPDNDIAVLKIDISRHSFAALGNSDSMKVGESIYVVGNPLGELTYTMTGGIISALDRDIAVESNASINMFQIDASVNSGNSGGPVYNSLGQVVGVVTAKYQSTGVEGLSFAIPVNDAARIADELIDHGYVSGKPYLGITVRTMTEQYASYYNSVVGAYVYSVDPASCAAKAGMEQGDVITKLNDKDIKTTADLTSAKSDYRAGDTVTVTVYRNGKYYDLKITFDEQTPTAVKSNTDTFNNNETKEEPIAIPDEAPHVAIPIHPDEDDEGGYEWSDGLRNFIERFFGSVEKNDEEESSRSNLFRHFGD